VARFDAEMRGQSAERLVRALDGAMRDRLLALLARLEGHREREPRAAVFRLEDHSDVEVLVIVAPGAVTVCDPLGRGDLPVADLVWVFGPVRADHQVAPEAARPEIDRFRPAGEAARAPPVRQVLRVGPGREDQLARRVEVPRDHQLPIFDAGWLAAVHAR